MQTPLYFNVLEEDPECFF